MGRGTVKAADSLLYGTENRSIDWAANEPSSSERARARSLAARVVDEANPTLALAILNRHRGADCKSAPLLEELVGALAECEVLGQLEIDSLSGPGGEPWNGTVEENRPLIEAVKGILGRRLEGGDDLDLAGIDAQLVAFGIDAELTAPRRILDSLSGYGEAEAETKLLVAPGGVVNEALRQITHKEELSPAERELFELAVVRAAEAVQQQAREFTTAIRYAQRHYSNVIILREDRRGTKLHLWDTSVDQTACGLYRRGGRLAPRGKWSEAKGVEPSYYRVCRKCEISGRVAPPVGSEESQGSFPVLSGPRLEELHRRLRPALIEEIASDGESHTLPSRLSQRFRTDLIELLTAELQTATSSGTNKRKLRNLLSSGQRAGLTRQGIRGIFAACDQLDVGQVHEVVRVGIEEGLYQARELLKKQLLAGAGR